MIDSFQERSLIRSINTGLIIFLLCFMINYNLGEFRYYFALPLLFLVWFLFVIENSLRLDKYITRAFFVSIFVCILLGVPSLFGVSPHKANLNYTYTNYIMSIIFKLFAAYTVIVLTFKWQIYKEVLDKVLFLNITVFYFQFFLVYATGYYPDFLEPITGEPQRYNSLFSIPILGNIYRPTGLYEEPSTYSSIILVLVACRFFINPKVDKIIILSVISTVLSLSVASIIYGTILGGYLLIKSRNTYYKYLPFLMAPLFISALGYLAFLRLGTVGNATELRNNLTSVVFEQNNIEILFGNGMMGTVNSLAQFVIDGNLWKAGVVTLNDNGLWLFIIIKFGLVGLLVMSQFFLKRLGNQLNILLFLIILVSKVSFLYFIFIFYFCTVYFLSSHNSKNNVNPS